MKKLVLILAAVLALPFASAFADELEDITMQVVDGDTPDAVLKKIELPTPVQERARAKSAGEATANQVRVRSQERHRVTQEESEALQAQHQEMHEYREQTQEQRREMHQNRQQTQEQLQGTREAVREGMGSGPN